MYIMGGEEKVHLRGYDHKNDKTNIHVLINISNIKLDMFLLNSKLLSEEQAFIMYVYHYKFIFNDNNRRKYVS